MRRLIAALCLAFAMSAQASTNTSEISDTWVTVGEGGWGANVVLQNNIAFITFFVYDVSRNPVWFIAVLSYAPGYIWSGSLYADRGPYYGGAFDPNTVTERTAGTATFTVHNLNSATLSYTIDGVTVIKQMERLTFTLENYTGTYAGGYSLRLSGCVPSSLNGIEEIAGLLTVSHSGSSFLIAASAPGTSCTFSGTYSQAGKLGAVGGTYTCVNGTIGTFQLIEMTPTISGFNARVAAQNQYCQASGYMGGISRAQ